MLFPPSMGTIFKADQDGLTSHAILWMTALTKEVWSEITLATIAWVIAIAALLIIATAKAIWENAIAKEQQIAMVWETLVAYTANVPMIWFTALIFMMIVIVGARKRAWSEMVLGTLICTIIAKLQD